MKARGSPSYRSQGLPLIERDKLLHLLRFGSVSLLTLMIALLAYTRYICFKTAERSTIFMAEKTKNLCAQIPESLHNRVREEQERSGQTLSQYVTWLITAFYEGSEKDMENTRTLAVQMPADLFERLDAYLASHKLMKKEFIISLVRNALDEEENAE